MTDSRSRLPSVNRLLDEAEKRGVLASYPRSIVREAIREIQAGVRSGHPAPSDWIDAIIENVRGWESLSLRPVINATGVVLHTNLGRAPLSQPARDAVQMALGYSSLEIDLSDGGRGSRFRHVSELLSRVTGAESAHVTVNAASALMLCLNTFSDDRDTIVSRGELVEIGGSFRLPDIMEKSGARLREVGTTNRTHAEDYRIALDSSDRVGSLLKVHRSNFVQSGYTAEVSIGELEALGTAAGVAVINDVGSGLLLDLGEFGLSGEPLVLESASRRVVTIFSGDKLMGGPQAGIVVGPRDMIEPLSRNPMARAVRPDKVTLTALEATLHSYLDRERAISEVPVLRMLTVSETELKKRGRRLARRIQGARIEPGESSVGGGSFPGAVLPTSLVVVPCSHPTGVAERLRSGSPALVVRTGETHITLDPRTLADEEIPVVGELIKNAIPAD